MLLIVLGVLALMLLVYPAITSAVQPDPLQEAWERARAAGAYDFTADVEQTLIPRPLPSMIGETDQRVDMRVEGEVVLPDYARLQLRFEGGGLDVPPLGLIQDGAEAFLLKDGEQIPVENPAALSSPTADYLGYLAAAENIQQLLSPEIGGGAGGGGHYTFDINGPRLAEYVRDQVEAQLRNGSQPLPSGVELSPSPLLQRMTGHGELWVDANGLPRRQVVDLEIPEITQEYNAQIHLVVDFDFGKSTSQQVNESASRRIGGMIENHIVRIAPSDVLCLMVAGVLAVALTASGRRRWVYAAIAVSVSIIMVVLPLLQVDSLVRFQTRQAEAAESTQPIAEALGLDTPAPKEHQYLISNTQYPIPNTLSPNLQSAVRNPQSKCGSGTPGEDTDSDGLNDQTEYCLGTDPFFEDSDRDLITDTVEVEGFDFGGRHWTADPFKADSNGDGAPDFAEWPSPIGEAPEWDPDGDNLPNLWDPDNDGDLVPDALDLSIYSRTTYADKFSLSSQGGGFDGYQYIEIQVQPQNMDHLRYTTTVLDWPHDELGPIQDLDDSTEDLRLVPMLKIRTDQAPDTELAQKYGVTVFTEDGDQYLYASLLPVGDGGQIVAFYTKVAYGPGELDDIRWEEARLVWVVQMNTDESAGDQIASEPTPIHTYAGETFRVTGLQIVKSKDFQSAILGTPKFPNDDTQLFNLIFGLSATFLNNQTPDLQTIHTRFTESNTDPVEKWGVTTTVRVDLPAAYGHADEGLADMSARLPRFLSDTGYLTNSTPSLVIATHEEIGHYNLSDQGQFEPPASLNVNLADIPMSLQRTLKRESFHYQDDRWQTMTLEESLEMVGERYADLSGALADLQAQYPELTEHDLEAVLYLFYAVWFLGQTRVLSLDGQDFAPAGRSDQEVYDQFHQPGAMSLPGYLIEATDLGQPGGGLHLSGNQAENWSYLRDRDQLAKDTGIGGYSVDIFNFDFNASDKAKLIGNIVVRGWKTALSVLTALQCIQWAVKGRYLGFTGWTKLAPKFFGPASKFGWFSRMKLNIRMLGVIGMVVSLVMIWVQFGLTTDWDNHLIVGQAIAYAVAATIFAVFLFVISLNPIGAILVALFCIVDLILYFAIDFSLSGWIVENLASLFYEVNELTYLESADFTDFDAGVVDENMGMIVGNRIQVSDKFVGEVKRTSDGDSDDLEDSYVYGEFSSSATGATAVDKNSSRSCSRSGRTLTCRNDVKVEYQLNTARRDVELQVMAYVRSKTYYEECGLYGLICDRESQSIDLPEDLEDKDQWGPETFYLDVLPNTLIGLWSWDAAPVAAGHVFNPDRDGDGLPNSQEVDTDPDDWDSDHDGLSDEFEFDSQETLGCDPLNPDSDGDGLSDGFEYRIHTRIDQADSDGDGLTDGEEVYHRDAAGQWVGGWIVNLPDTTRTIRVFSDPLQSDADNDGLNDFTERANNTSPYAYNDAPRLTLESEPLAYSPGGVNGVYVEPGDMAVFTLTLESVGPRPITSTLTLCLPDFLTDLQGGDLQGDRTPPRQPAPDCNGFQWSFTGEHTLQLWEVVSTTLTATVDPGLSTSVISETVASLPYQVGDEVKDITERVPVVVDVDNPQVTIVAPEDGALLGGGISAYVVGGSASDPTTWVERVEVDLPGEGTVTAEGISPWAYTWNLPADGVYDLTAVAYDHLGHPSPPYTVSVTVDNTAPAVTLDLADGAYVTGQPGNAGAITITLTGAASDNRSGLVRVQVSTDGKPWREVWAEGGYPLAANWSTDWTLPNEESAQGEHTVAVRAFDRAGNESDTLQRTIIVDVVPPTDELTNRSYLTNPPHAPAGQPHTLHGVANDAGNVPPPSRPAELVGTLDSIDDATLWLGLSSIDENDDGVNVAWLGDFNGDRLADLAVGLPAAGEQGSGGAGGPGSTGQVVIVYGRAGGWPVPTDAEMLAESGTSFVGKAGAGIGGSMVAAGDVDGDGLNDLLIGDVANSRVYLVFGRPIPLGQNLLLDQPQPAVWSVIDLTGLGNLSGLGAAGDVNGDGFDDLLIGVTGTENKVYLLLGQASPWWETVELDVHTAAQIEVGSSDFSHSGVGDMDGDQLDEFVVATGNTVYLFAGDDGFAARANETLTLTDTIATFASSNATPQVAALGDVNNDNMADFIYANGDEPKLVFGDENRNWTTHAIAGFTPAPSGFLAAPGDVDADGLDDLLIGNADDNAYLILGKDLSAVEATLTGVETAASAPYAAGADLNSDGSSDLLLVPTEAAAADKGLASPGFGEIPYINPEWLPVAAFPSPRLGEGSGVRALATTHYVDDDGDCTGQSPCHTTIQAAVNAASAGDTINVLPGVYDAFTINGKNNLTVRGVHSDAVFVDGDGGSHAAKIQNATGVRLEKLTLRDAVNAIVLENAGVNGYDNQSLITNIQYLLIYDFTSHAVYMDRTSTVRLTRCTLAGGDNHIDVSGDPDPAFAADWATISPGGTPAAANGGGVVPVDGKLYLMPGNGSDELYRYDSASNTWTAAGELAPIPDGLVPPGALAAGNDGNLYAASKARWLHLGGGTNSGVANMAIDSDGNIFAVGWFAYAGGTYVNHIAKWNGSSWEALGGGLPGWDIDSVTVDGHGNVYSERVIDEGGGVYNYQVVKWDGSTWQVIGDHMESGIQAIVVDDANSYVYVGGYSIVDPPGTYHYFIMRWDGSSWDLLAPRKPGYIYDMALVSNGNLYVGGDFDEIGGVTAQNVAKWNGSSWQALGDSVGALRTMTTDKQGRVYVGGYSVSKKVRRWNGSTWESLGDGPSTNTVYAIVVDGNHVYAGGGNAGSDGDVFHWDGTSWQRVHVQLNNAVYAMVLDGDDLVIGGLFSAADGFTVNRVAHWIQPIYRYDVAGNTWTQPTPSPQEFYAGLALAADDAGHIYTLVGGDTALFYRYNIGADTWEQRANLPDTVNAGSALAWASGHVYAFRGGSQDFCRYTPGSNSWNCALQDAPYGIYAGASLAWDGRDWIYALTGGNGKQFLRYHIPTDQWQVLGDGNSTTPNDKDAPAGVNAGGGLVRIGQELYGIPGGGEAQLWRYDPIGVYPEKLTLDHVAFVVPKAAAAPTWLEIEGVDPLNLRRQPDDFMVVGSDNGWVAGSGVSWSPNPATDPPLGGSSTLTHIAARFVDAARDVYRVGAGTALNAGYHTYRATAFVAPSGVEFTSIQDAILSGANTVVVKPGQYPQSFYLISGVNVLGSRADQTILEPLPGHTGPLVTAEGVVGVRLSGFTLAGDGNQDGLRVEDGAQSITFGRNIVRGTETGISVLGSETDLEVVNNTIVENTNGMVASACAPVDVRNTIFAYHSGTGLSYEPCAATKLHTYNDFWLNGTDLSPAEPGAGEIFLDPLFVDRFAHDYRTMDDSPVIDAGNPTDPAPPGTGDRVDIGYIEQGRAAYYADDDYCETCANDGLTWQVDAFDVIQDALDAAADDMAALEATEPPPQYTVGVGPGTYTETVTITGYVRLVGSGAEDTTIDAGGSGSPVTLDGVVQAEVSGFTLIGAGSPGVAVSGASNNITITRNVIRDNPTGIAFSERASGLVTFNTLVDNSGDGISSNGIGSWATVENNILSGNGTGLHTLYSGHIFNDYNLLNNTTANYNDAAGTGLAESQNELVNVDPLFVDAGAGNYRLQPTSPAMDAASPFAEVPAGGGELADLGYRELLAAPVSVFLGKEDVSTTTGNSGVKEVEVGFSQVGDPSSAVTDTLPITWTAVTLDTPEETVSYWQTSYTPTQESLYRFYSRATDMVGNQETEEEDWYEGAFVADDTPPVVTWLEPVHGATLPSPLELRAKVSDYAAGEFSVRDVHFEVKGSSYAAQWAAEPWDEENEKPRVFRAWISLVNGAYNNVVAIAEDKAGNVGQSNPIAFTVTGGGGGNVGQSDPMTFTVFRQLAEDTTPPTLTISSPAEGGWVRQTVIFSGTVSDGKSGVASVEVSVDGGTTWMPATVDGEDWELTWEAPEGQDFVSYPVRVRASDRAGNTTTLPRNITIDNLPPTGLEPVTFSAPQGTHFDAPTPLTINWHEPQDASGTAVSVLAVDQISDTTPTQEVPGTTATVPLALSGQWYVHLGAKDEAGNQFIRHYGPWYVGTLSDSECSQRQQSVIVDGYLDLANGEWRDSEFLDDDERPVVQNPNSETQELYATWDGKAFYLGWQGTWWSLDGELWAYLDVGPGGSTQPVGTGGAAPPLPFAADYAIEVDSPSSGTLWSYDGISWHAGPLEFGHGESGGTEIRIPLDIPRITDLQLIAFALDDEGEPWSVFPTTNPLEGPWNDAYHWNDPCSVSEPNDGQPQGVTVVMALSSPQAPQAAWGPGNSLKYVVDLTNYEADEVVGLQLAFNAIAGLTYQTKDGATCTSGNCTAGDDQWLLDVPPLPAGGSHHVTVTGQLAADLSSLSQVMTTVALQLDTTTLAQASLSHGVDGQPPTVSVSRAGETLKPGLQTIHGDASDGDGIGVAGVQCREGGTITWQDATGTMLWACEMDVPAAITFQLEAQAKDKYDQASDVVLAEFTVDPTPPLVNWSLPTILSGDCAEIGGTTTDPYPVGGEVNQVEVQLDQDTASWRTAQVYAPDATTGIQDWLWTWSLPREDGVIHTLRARATDAAGNETTTGWQSTLVDTVPPEVTVTTVINDVVLGDYWPGSGTGPPMLEGTANDGDSVDDVFVHVNLPDGDSYRDVATLGLSSRSGVLSSSKGRIETRHSPEWSYTPELTQCGHHTLRLEVTDRAGNATLKGTFDLFVDAPEFTAAFVSAQPTGSVSLTARVSNDGGKEAAAGVSVAFYLGDPEVGGTLIGTTTTSQALDPGEWEDVSVNWDWETPGDHDIYIVADDDGTGASQIAECEENNNTTHHIVSIVDVPLVESWNLMSSYVNPFNTNASVVQIPIAGQYVVIQGFDGGGQSYYPDLPPAVNTLKDMDGEHGYWVKVKGAGGQGSRGAEGQGSRGAEEQGSVATLRVVGEKFAEDRAIELDAGWNLVSYLPRNPMAVADALQSIDGQYTVVLGYDQGALSYYPDIDPSFNTLYEMELLHGYWIKMTEASTLQYPTTGGAQILDIGYSEPPIPNIHQAERDAGVTPTHTWVNFYGTAHWPDGTPLPVGTAVLALDPDGIVCGATVVTTEGQYGLLACYSDDPTTLEDEGAMPEDIIQLVVDGQVLGMGTWTAHGDRQWTPLGKVDLWQLYLPLVRKEYR